MVIDRRTTLKGIAVLSTALLAPSARAASSDRYAAAYRTVNGFGLAILDETGRILRTEALPFRGHGSAVSGDGRLLVHFARRPGTVMTVLDLSDPTRVRRLSPPPTRRLSGHGFFSRDDRLLYTVENDFEAERGVLGIHDVCDGFRRVGELSTGGIGPHEALLLKNGNVAAVANGGIATHPDYPRMKLNLPDMKPSVVLLDLSSGREMDRAEPPAEWHQLSLRHLAEDAAGRIWLGGQYEGPAGDHIPLIQIFSPGAGMVGLSGDAIPYRRMNQYVGSIAANNDGSKIAVTSPRGGVWIIFDSKSLRVQEVHDAADVSGIAPLGDHILATDGHGNVWMSGYRLKGAENMAWDNHLTRIRTVL